MRSVVYLVRATVQNAQLIARQIKDSLRCVPFYRRVRRYVAGSATLDAFASK